MDPSTNVFVIIFAVLVILGAILYTFWPRRRMGEEPERLNLDKHHKNPVLTSARDWEAAGTFNPAAVIDNDGNTHILYRAIGEDGISRLGYAGSKDGTHFDERSDYPVFTMRNPRLPSAGEAPAPAPVVQKVDPVMYPSGGSWGGCEDPRMVKIGNRIYVTFNAFDGWDYIRIGIISIDEKKFLKKQWDWTEPFLISPQGEVNKNWVLFPEKINGKFAILHSISPTVQIDYADYLEELANGTKSIKSKFGQKKDRNTWDTWVRGAGPPPVKTDKGWLVLYHAIEKKEPSNYKLGALLLDLDNPTKVLARSPSPILGPEHWYENDWKPGVVYACGAVVKDDVLSVYYGGGDKHVCVAQTSLPSLLDWLLKYGKQQALK